MKKTIQLTCLGSKKKVNNIKELGDFASSIYIDEIDKLFNEYGFWNNEVAGQIGGGLIYNIVKHYYPEAFITKEQLEEQLENKLK